MVLAPSVASLFKWRQFEPEVILLAVGWYLRFSLSYRDVEALLAERGISVDHVTLWRWVQRYTPELERRLRKGLKATNDSWRVDETYGQVGVFMPGRGFRGCNDRLPSFGQARHRGRQALSRQSFGRCEPSAPSGHQHRQRRSLPASPRTTQSRGCFGGELPASTGALSEQRFGTGSSGHQTSGPRQSRLPFLLGSFTHNCRLRGDPYDPQRPGVLECGGCEGLSVAPFHSRSVRCDQLNFRLSTPIFGSTTKLQHIRNPGIWFHFISPFAVSSISIRI
jgi:hypothetical protein